MQNTQRQQPANGTFVWSELLTKDQNAAIRFYRTLFGWDINQSPNPEHGGYQMIQYQGNGIGGIMQMSAQRGPELAVGAVHRRAQHRGIGA